MADMSNFISQLRDIRCNLRDALNSASGLEVKMLGPRPSEGSTAKQPAESVATLLVEISSMSLQMTKTLSRHHEIIGDFGPQAECASPSRYA